jgi:hypothetical protein
MKVPKLGIATAELLLVFPATLFMVALFVRNLQPIQYEPAHTAQWIVNWYAARVHIGLWGLLFALPVIVLLSGSAILRHAWKHESELRKAVYQVATVMRTHLPSLLVAGATFTAAAILGIVALHVATD